MPLYEYEPLSGDCLICNGRFESLQGVNDPPHTFCPTCGMDCKRVVSKAQVKVAKYHGDHHAGRKGFTTYKKVEKGVWEKTGGEGPDGIKGTPEDIAAVEAEKLKPAKKFDLDKPV